MSKDHASTNAGRDLKASILNSSLKSQLVPAAQEDAPESRHRTRRSHLADLGRTQKTEVAVLQDSLSHLSMPQRPEEPRGPLLNPSRQLPALKARRQEIGYAGMFNEQPL